MAQDDLVSPLRVVSVLDPALDRVAMDVALYAETRDPALVRELPGQRARWVTLQPLTGSDALIVDCYSEQALKLKTAFVYSVACIENFERPTEHLRPTRVIATAGGGERFVWTDAEWESIFRVLNMKFVYEMGLLAIDRAFSKNFGGGCDFYTQPPFLSDELARIGRQLAARARRSAGTPSSAKSAPSSTTSSSPSSAAATAANAASGSAGPAAGSPAT
jgi:hypothetical protein